MSIGWDYNNNNNNEIIIILIERSSILKTSVMCPHCASYTENRSKRKEYIYPFPTNCANNSCRIQTILPCFLSESGADSTHGNWGKQKGGIHIG